jgi:hypothetical protein
MMIWGDGSFGGTIQEFQTIPYQSGMDWLAVCPRGAAARGLTGSGNYWTWEDCLGAWLVRQGRDGRRLTVGLLSGVSVGCW